MLADKYKDRVSLICHATTGRMLAELSNPNYRGAAFSWDNFPKMAASSCRTQVMLSMPMTNKIQAQCLEHAEKTGLEIATEWLRLMTE